MSEKSKDAITLEAKQQCLQVRKSNSASANIDAKKITSRHAGDSAGNAVPGKLCDPRQMTASTAGAPPIKGQRRARTSNNPRGRKSPLPDSGLTKLSPRESAERSCKKPSPLLDTIQNNGDSPRDPYRLSRCGKLTLRGLPQNGSGPAKFVGVTCKCWECPRCGPRKANRYRKAIGQLAEAHRLNVMLTLTLDPKKLAGQDSTSYINRVFRHFRTYLKRKLQRAPQYIRILEYHKTGIAHLHVLIHGYIPQKWISDAWSSLGGGKVVDIRRVSMHRVSHYLSKYLTKQMLLSAPKRSRRVTTSRGLKLNPRILSELTWNLISVPITRLYEVYWKNASNVSYDAEGNVTGFDLAFESNLDSLPAIDSNATAIDSNQIEGHRYRDTVENRFGHTRSGVLISTSDSNPVERNSSPDTVRNRVGYTRSEASISAPDSNGYSNPIRIGNR